MRKSGLTNSSKKEVSGAAIQAATLSLPERQYIMPSARVAPGEVTSMLIMSPSLIW